jgi:hypothetical protein
MIGEAHYTRNFERRRVASPIRFSTFRTIPLGHTKSELVVGKVKDSNKWKAQSFLISRSENPKVRKELLSRIKRIVKQNRR